MSGDLKPRGSESQEVPVRVPGEQAGGLEECGGAGLAGCTCPHQLPVPQAAGHRVAAQLPKAGALGLFPTSSATAALGWVNPRVLRRLRDSR